MALADFQAFVEQVRAASPIEDVIGRYAEVKRKGRQLWCSAPYRVDKDPSLAIYPDQGSWYDYGEHNGGDVFDFIGRMEDLTFRKAVDFLADKVGMKWAGGNGGGAFEPEVQAEIDRLIKRRRILKLQTEAAIYYAHRLPRHIRDHFSRHYGFTADFIKEARIGWSDGTLQQHLEGLGYSMPDMLASGLFIRTQAGRVFELHEKRATIPYPLNGTYPYMISRRIEGQTPDNDYQKAKYKKSLTRSDKHPYVDASVRNDVFYGEDSVRHGGTVCVITEGVTDAGSALMHGFKCISPVTVRFRELDHDKLIELTEGFGLVVIINDSEEPKVDQRTGRISQPGLEGALKTADALYRAGRNVKIVMLPKPKGAAKIDLNEFLRDHGRSELDRLIRKAQDYVEFVIDQIPTDAPAAELDEALLPVYEIIAACPGRVRAEAYVNRICRRFRLTKKTVRESVKEFVARSQADGGEGDGGGDGDDGDGPPSGKRKKKQPRRSQDGELLHGHIYEHDKENFYFVYTEEGIKRISNFIIYPKRRVYVEGGIRLLCDIEMLDGRSFDDILLPENTFNSSRDLIRVVQKICFGAVWSGKDTEVQGMAELLYSQKLPVDIGIERIGYVESDEGPRIVTPTMIIGPNGPVEDSTLVYAPRTPGPFPLASRLDLSGIHLSKVPVERMMQRVMPLLFKLHTPETLLVLMNWFTASAAAPVFRKELGHFPLCWVAGSAGAGKTSLVRDIFMRFVGIDGDPFSCSDTKFAMISTLSCSSSFPAPLDEWKHDIPQTQREIVMALWRKGYVGEVEQRGRRDQGVNVYPLLTPVVIMGEMMPTDPALLERIVAAYPYKTDLSDARRDAMRRLVSEQLTLLAAPFLKWLCGHDVRDDIDSARASMRTALLPQLRNPLPPRIADNLLVLAAGDVMHRKWCQECGVDVSKRPKLIDHFKAIVGNITESEEGGHVKDAFDLLLESLSTYVQLDLIRENVHYTFMNDQLCLHLESCHAVYAAEQRRRGLPDETNGLRALRRVITEKIRMPHSYILEAGRRVRMTSDLSGTSRQVRAVVLDPQLIPDNLAVEPFPRKYQRSHGKKDWEDIN